VTTVNTVRASGRTVTAAPDRCAICSNLRTDYDRRYVTGNDELCAGCRADLPPCAICRQHRTAQDLRDIADEADDDGLCARHRAECAAADIEAALELVTLTECAHCGRRRTGLDTRDMAHDDELCAECRADNRCARCAAAAPPQAPSHEPDTAAPTQDKEHPSMSTRPSTGRRPRHDGEEVDMFDGRRAHKPRAGRAKQAKTRANRRARRTAKRQQWTA
jgi:hypothetical protein